MAINYELINKGGISLGTNFELLSEKPLDSRLVVPSLAGLQNYIDNAAAYEGMIVFDKDTKKTYQVQTIDGVLSYREFGINENELKDLIAAETTAAMEFKGAASALPENPAKGDMWKVSAVFKVNEVDVKVGDSIVYNGEEWFIIPSGDDIEDTWRPVDGVDNDAALKFAAGDKLDVAVANDGTITYSHEAIAAPELLAENEQTRTYITAVETDGHGHITGYKTATENVEDTDTTYTFECQVEEGHSNVHFSVKASTDEHAQEICLDAYTRNEVDAKVKALNLEIYGNEVVQETSRIDTAVADAAEAKSTANTAAGDATQAKADAAEALRIAGEANTAAGDAKDGAAASAAAAAASASEALASQNAASASASAAATSESNAAESATTATQKANAASQSANAAAQSKTDAEAAQALAAGYADSADASATAASGAKDAAVAAQGAAESARDEATAKANAAASSAGEAAGSASDALASKNAAAESASTAATKAGDAEAARAAAVTAKEAAELAETNAETAEANARLAQTAAENAKTGAETAQGKANTAAANAATSETNAKASETAAAGSASAAATSASDAAKAQVAAEAAQAAAEASNTSATAIANDAKAKAEAAVGTANAAKATAEKAIQDVANVADNGLILSKSADNKVSVDWDPNAVFVFNCGSATKLVD